MNTLREQLTSVVQVPVCSGPVTRNSGIPKTFVFRILHVVLQLYSYKLQSLQLLLPDDAAKRMPSGNCALLEFEENSQWLFNILWTDEVLRMEQLMHINVESGQRRTHMYSQRNPYKHHPYTLLFNMVYLGNFCGAFFFEERCARFGWKTWPVNGKLYLEMLQDKVIPCLLENNVFEKVIFMQDGAPPHISTKVKRFLQKAFIDARVLSRHFTHKEPPCSPDLTTRCFFALRLF